MKRRARRRRRISWTGNLLLMGHRLPTLFRRENYRAGLIGRRRPEQKGCVKENPFVNQINNGPKVRPTSCLGTCPEGMSEMKVLYLYEARRACQAENLQILRISFFLQIDPFPALWEWTSLVDSFLRSRLEPPAFVGASPDAGRRKFPYEVSCHSYA